MCEYVALNHLRVTSIKNTQAQIECRMYTYMIVRKNGI